MHRCGLTLDEDLFMIRIGHYPDALSNVKFFSRVELQFLEETRGRLLAHLALRVRTAARG